MAIIQLNAPSVNKTTKAFVEGNGRRKFLATIVKTDPSNIVPAFADNVQMPSTKSRLESRRRLSWAAAPVFDVREPEWA